MQAVLYNGHRTVVVCQLVNIIIIIVRTSNNDCLDDETRLIVGSVVGEVLLTPGKQARLQWTDEMFQLRRRRLRRRHETFLSVFMSDGQ